MSKKNNRHVVQGEGNWRVVAPNADRASGVYSTQREAIDAARGFVDNLGGGEVVIHGRNGQIRDSDSVGGGSDPFPPRDTK